jgi:hypothetical protein
MFQRKVFPQAPPTASTHFISLGKASAALAFTIRLLQFTDATFFRADESSVYDQLRASKPESRPSYIRSVASRPKPLIRPSDRGACWQKAYSRGVSRDQLKTGFQHCICKAVGLLNIMQHGFWRRGITYG